MNVLKHKAEHKHKHIQIMAMNVLKHKAEHKHKHIQIVAMNSTLLGNECPQAQARTQTHSNCGNACPQTQE